MLPEITLVKSFSFEAAHCLEGYPGNCARLHGHTYRLEVAVKGKVQENDMVLDFDELKALVKENVIDKVDHYYLNEIFPFRPTCERLLWYFWQALTKALSKYPHVELEKLILWETPNSAAVLTRAAVEACKAAHEG
ncbi:MAG: 6-pyruvoyltetrahydropterin/6-carboxytetrahydropterin synthase [Clostridia bacterium]|nr:6-pyruvoyltetrahydropterin/6-carboxytetrahydropterin synthase [Clostridia bacterium]